MPAQVDQTVRLTYAPAQGQWGPLSRTVFADRPDEAWAMLPMTIISGVYDRPDGVIDKPRGYADADGVLGEMVRTRLRQEVSVQTLKQANRDWFYFEKRHIDKRWEIKHRQTTRDAARPASDTYGDTLQDWDFVMTFRDRILAREGLTAQSPPRDIAYAIGWELCRNWRGGGSRNHPADVLTHRSWCLGAATTAMAILESLGIPCRGSAVSEHATCEVQLDGRWHLIDSSKHIIAPETLSTAFMPTDYAQLTTNPTSPEHGSEISDHHRGLFYHFADAHYGIPDGRWIRNSLLEYCPSFANALYPNRNQYKFKTLDPKRLAILKRDKVPAVEHFKLWQDLNTGDRLRDEVYLGDLDGLRAVELQLRLYPIDGQLPSREQLNTLEFELNGHVLPVSQLSSEPWKVPKLDPGRLTLTLPVETFVANQANVFEWINRGSKDQIFRFALLPAVVEAKG